MVLQSTIDILKDDKMSPEKKYEFIKRMDFTYSDLITLQKEFEGDELVHRMLMSFFDMLHQTKLGEQLKKQERKRRNAVKCKRMKGRIK